MTLRAPTLDDPCTSEPCHASDVGSYQLEFKAESKHNMDTAAESLEKLLNGSVDVDVSIEGCVVAHAHLDLLPVAQGSASVQARLNLVPAPESGRTLKPNSNITLAVHLAEQKSDTLPDSPAHGADATHPTARVPFQFLDEHEASESTVASISCLPTSDLPSELLNAASFAMGGIDIHFGLMWLSESCAHGFGSAIACCDGQSLKKYGRCRKLLRRDTYLSLRDTASSGGSFYVELARSLPPVA